MKLSRKIIYLLFVLFTTSCITTGGSAPVADFGASQTNINAGDSISFNDLSTNSPTSWSWTFQGGTPSTSTLQNPSNILYNTAGTYNVTLISTNASGNNALTKSAYIIVATPNTQIPTISTTTIGSITNTAASSGGNIMTEGSSAVTARGVCWNTSPNPTIVNTKTINGTGIGVFTSSLTGLNTNTTYYVRAYAINSFGTAYGNQISFTTTNNTFNCGSTVTDIDGNIYHTISIGSQCWIVENLKTTKYNDGTLIPEITDNTQWSNLTTGAYSYYLNDTSKNSIYGKLYNWHAVSSGKLAPIGWHIPTDTEWVILTTYLGGTNVAGGKMKSTSSLWKSPNAGATNSSGFTSLPGGQRNDIGAFNSIKEIAYFWSSTSDGNSDHAWYRTNTYLFGDVERANPFMKNGMSIRCIKD